MMLSGQISDYNNIFLSGEVEKDIALFKEIFKKDSVLRIKRIRVRNRSEFDCALLYMDGMTDSDQLNEAVIRPLLVVDVPNDSDSLAEYVERQILFVRDLTAISSAFLLYFAVLPLAERLFGEKAVTCKRIPLQVLICLIYTAVAILSLWLVADSFLDFVNFVKDVILPRSSITLIIIVFTVVCLFFSSRRQEDILKFFLISFWLALILIVFFFLVTLPNFSLRNIFIFRLPDIKTLYNQTKPYIINPVLPSFLLPVYNVLVFKKSRKGAAFSGLAIGGGLLGLCILSGVLLFGTAFAGELPYPYAAAVSTVTVGRLFTRMDGFSYFIYFAAALCKITVCLFIMYSCLKNIAGVLGGSILQNKKD